MKKRIRIASPEWCIWRWIWRTGALIILCLLEASATTVVKLELPALVRQAESIVQGQVEQVYVQWDARRRLAFTYASVRVEDPMKGERRRSVLVRHIGGQIGAMSLHVSGMPKFAAGDRVILFLKTQQDGTFQVLGLNQGKYSIANGYAISNLSGLDLVDPKTGTMVEAGVVAQMPLTEFKAKIMELLR